MEHAEMSSCPQLRVTLKARRQPGVTVTPLELSMIVNASQGERIRTEAREAVAILRPDNYDPKAHKLFSDYLRNSTFVSHRNLFRNAALDEVGDDIHLGATVLAEMGKQPVVLVQPGFVAKTDAPKRHAEDDMFQTSGRNMMDTD